MSTCELRDNVAVIIGTCVLGGLLWVTGTGCERQAPAGAQGSEPPAAKEGLALGVCAIVLTGAWKLAGDRTPKATARELYHAGHAARHASDYETAEAKLREALREYRRDGDEWDAANCLSLLGNVQFDRGLLGEALSLLESGLEIVKRLAPDSLAVASNLNAIGNIHWKQGDLEKALEYHRRAASIRRRLAPDSVPLARTLGNIGIVYGDQGNPDKALEYYRRALEVFERLAPESVDVANTLNNIALVHRAHGEPQKARQQHWAALEICRRVAPNSLAVAHSLGNLGIMCREQGELEMALDHFQEGLEINERLAPNSLDLANSLHNIGTVYHDQGNQEKALEHYRRALPIRQRLAPDSLFMAFTLNAMGEAWEAQGDPAKAADWYAKALDTLERTRSRAGGPGGRTAFGGSQTYMYRNVVRVLLTQGKADEAFAWQERGRARTLVELLAERAIDFGEGAPKELLREQAELRARRDALQTRLLAGQRRDDRQAMASLRSELIMLTTEEEDLALRVRKASPRYAELQYPKPLDFRGAQESLSPGTLLLAYTVDEQQTHLFALSREGGLTVHSAPACETGLGKQAGGEGIIGLTRAFMYAGAPSVIVSLWKVGDESTALLMETFYRRLRTGDTKDVALQKAMQQVKADPRYRHAYYWAPFILVGDPSGMP